jgi:hypothetical protein
MQISHLSQEERSALQGAALMERANRLFKSTEPCPRNDWLLRPNSPAKRAWRAGIERVTLYHFTVRDRVRDIAKGMTLRELKEVSR